MDNDSGLVGSGLGVFTNLHGVTLRRPKLTGVKRATHGGIILPSSSINRASASSGCVMRDREDSVGITTDVGTVTLGEDALSVDPHAATTDVAAAKPAAPNHSRRDRRPVTI